MHEPFDLSALLAWRAERDERYRTHYTSPIPEDDLPAFTGLRYFDPDPTLCIRAPFSPTEGTLEITYSSGRASEYRVAGHLDLTLGVTTHRLVVLYGEDDELFIPFRDATSGTDSYGGGRYARMVRLDDRTAVVDFNRATNPPCAYDDEFSCPLPPPENWLPVPVRAGEMSYRSEPTTPPTDDPAVG